MWYSVFLEEETIQLRYTRQARYLPPDKMISRAR